MSTVRLSCSIEPIHFLTSLTSLTFNARSHNFHALQQAVGRHETARRDGVPDHFPVAQGRYPPRVDPQVVPLLIPEILRRVRFNLTRYISVTNLIAPIQSLRLKFPCIACTAPLASTSSRDLRTVVMGTGRSGSGRARAHAKKKQYKRGHATKNRARDIDQIQDDLRVEKLGQEDGLRGGRGPAGVRQPAVVLLQPVVQCTDNILH